LTAYPGCGHFPQLDAAPLFAQDLIEYLQQPARPAARLRGVRSRPAPTPPSRWPVTPPPGEREQVAAGAGQSPG
ncbi:MAG TPA: hypothetical protein VGQ83_03560, partial [Polyangia bacterium]